MSKASFERLMRAHYGLAVVNFKPSNFSNRTYAADDMENRYKGYCDGLLRAKQLAGERVATFRATRTNSRIENDLRGAKIKAFEYYIQQLEKEITP